MDEYSSVFVVFCINFISRNRVILKQTHIPHFLAFQFITKYFTSGQMTNMLLNFSILELCCSQKGVQSLMIFFKLSEYTYSGKMLLYDFNVSYGSVNMLLDHLAPCCGATIITP